MKWYLFLSFFVILFGCKSNKSPEVANRMPRHQELWIEQFSLPYGDSLKTDSTSILFYKRARFDTSYAVNLKNFGDIVAGVCYWVKPSMDSINDANMIANVQHFEGISFNLEKSFWQEIQNKIRGIKLNSEKVRSYPGCCDISIYSLAFDSKVFGNTNEENQNSLDEFDRYLRTILLSRIIRGSSK